MRLYVPAATGTLKTFVSGDPESWCNEAWGTSNFFMTFSVPPPSAIRSTVMSCIASSCTPARVTASRKPGILTESVICAVPPPSGGDGAGEKGSSCRQARASGRNNRNVNRLRNAMAVELFGIIYGVFMICIS